MIRLLEVSLSVALYFFAAMALGGLIIATHLWFVWGLTPSKVRQGLAVMRGDKTSTTVSPIAAPESKEPPEEPSYDAILVRRALEYHDLELKMKILTNYKDEVENLRRQLDQKEKLVAEREKKVETLIAQTRQDAENAGRDTVRRTLESLRPTQAKEILIDMLNRNETDEVVRLFEGMNDSKRARIIAEFRNPDEAAKIAEVLRRLRQGGLPDNFGTNAQESFSNATPAVQTAGQP